MGRVRRLLGLLLLPLLLVGCSDPGSALSRAESTGVLTVGVVENPPGTVAEESGEVSGPDAERISSYADSIGAHPTWQVGKLDALADAVGRGEVDVIIGADESADGLVATSGSVALVGEEETPLKESIDAWSTDQE